MPVFIMIWLHLIAATALIGGLLFFQIVLKPGLCRISAEADRQDILRVLGRRFKTVTWVCLVTLIVTGAFNMLYEGGSARIETWWGVVLMMKLFVFAVAFGLFLIHDFVVDPYGPIPGGVERSPEAAAAHIRRASRLQQAILVLTLGILLIAAYLATM